MTNFRGALGALHILLRRALTVGVDHTRLSAHGNTQQTFLPLSLRSTRSQSYERQWLRNIRIPWVYYHVLWLSILYGKVLST